MALAFFERLADPTKAIAICGGSQPAPRIHPQVVGAMRELDVDLSRAAPTKLTSRMLHGASLLVTLDWEGDPPSAGEARHVAWKLPVMKEVTRPHVRLMRDEIARRVRHLIEREGWVRDWRQEIIRQSRMTAIS